MSAWHGLVGQLPCDWAQFAFMQNALLTVLIVSPLFALLGCMVIGSQMTFFSDAIGHAALTGIAIGAIAGLADPLWAMLAFAALLTLAISLLKRYAAASTDTIIGLVMAFTVALGVVLLSRGGNFARFSRYLIGDILTITPSEIARLLGLLALIAGVWMIFFNRIFFVTLNRSLARSRGIHAGLVETFFAVVVALTVTVCIPLVGLLVINSLLILPAATARNFSSSVRGYSLSAIGVSLLAGVSGLIASYYWGTATGATIVLFAMGCFIVSLPFRRR